MADCILVSDFDGTITKNDFYRLVVERLLLPADLEPWGEYRAGKITHLQALQRIFMRIHAPESVVLDVVRDMQPDPMLARSIQKLRTAGWDVVVASAGCLWYIEKILAEAGVKLEVHANPGLYHQDNGPLEMLAPTDSQFYSPETGIDKAAIVRFHEGQGKTLAFAGDGYPDIHAAMLVPAERRFAKDDLAEELNRRGEQFQPFSVWSEVADTLARGAK